MALVEKLLLLTLDFVKRAGLWTLFLISLGIFLLRLLYKIWNAPKPAKNPLSTEFLREPEPLVLEKEKRDAVLKAGFSSKKVPSDLDAIVIGSGIGGLTVAALMAKAGKKVLVLEQHDQAGGCCHTFVEKGFEFDVGIHYIGNVTGQSMTHVLTNQITDNQITWVPLEDNYDTVVLGNLDDNPLKIPIYGKGPKMFEEKLIELFPKEEKAIMEFMELLKKSRKSMAGYVMIKTMPRFFAQLLIKTGLIHFVTDFFKYSKMSVADVLDGLTDNKDLKAVLAYNYGDYGTAPKSAPFIMQSLLLNHFLHGAYYPKGGASEIAFHAIPVIRRSGGEVLVRAPVSQILIDADGKATGVTVRKGGEDYNITAPLVISNAGIYNTYERLVPTTHRGASIQDTLSRVQHGPGAMSVFIGLDATKEELGLKAQNFWVYSSNDLDKSFDEYMSLSADKAGTEDIPLLFISFPSTKDPTWEQRFPGKTTCAIVTLGNFEWFANWENGRVGKRGDEYEDIKMRIAEKMWQQTCKLFPQIQSHRVFFDVGSPVTNNYYIGASRGEIYGIDHDIGRFTPEAAFQLRPETPIPGLILTGQDIFTCGFSGGMYGGLLAASIALNRNCLLDLMKFSGQMKKEQKKQS